MGEEHTMPTTEPGRQPAAEIAALLDAINCPKAFRTVFTGNVTLTVERRPA